MDLAQRARAYLRCIEGARSFDEVAAFLHPEVVQVEHPNRLVGGGKTRVEEAVRLIPTFVETNATEEGAWSPASF